MGDVTLRNRRQLPDEKEIVYCFSSVFEDEEPLDELVLDVPLGVEPISASSGAGGGVVSMVHPIQPVMPKTPRTAMTTGAPRTHGLQAEFVSATIYPMKTRTEITKMSPP